jgi:hypothetical protein
VTLECGCGFRAEVPEGTTVIRCARCDGLMLPPVAQPALGEDAAFQRNTTHTRDDF